MGKFYLSFVLILLKFGVHSSVEIQSELDVNFSHRSITSPSITRCFKSVAPPSTSSVITYLEKHNPGHIRSLNLRDNNITLEGAAEIIRYAKQELPALEWIDLSFNNIYEAKGASQDGFEEVMKDLLCGENFKYINLGGNGISHLGWIQKMSSFPESSSYIEKIKW